MVRCRPTFGHFIVLEQRRIGDPQELEAAAATRLRNQSQFLAEVQAQVRHDRVHFVCRTKLQAHDVARFDLERAVDGLAQVVSDVLRERALRPRAVIADFRARVEVATPTIVRAMRAVIAA